MTRRLKWASAGRLGAGFAIWTLFGLFFTSQAYLAQTYFGRGLSFGDALMRWMSCAYAWALLTPLVVRLCRYFPIDRQRWRTALAVHLPASLAFSLAAMLLFSLAEQALHPSGQFLSRDAFAKLFAAGLNIDLLIYATLVGTVYAAEHYRRYRERELSAAELQAALAHAELNALRAQLHPHFLFNTLNSIGILMEEDARAARKMLVHLGDLLRTLLKAERTQEVSVREELALLESYLEIERVRFHDRLQVDVRVDPEVLDARVPDLLLQPLVENAIKHGVVPRAAGGRVEILVQRQGACLRLEVRDDGPGLDPLRAAQAARGTGVGLANTRVRLEKLYGERQQLELKRGAPHGLCVVLTLPFRLQPEGAAP